MNMQQSMNPPLSVHATFSLRSLQARDSIAVVGDGVSLTYGELDARADRLARYLRAQGVERGARVGLYTQRSVDAIVALLGILKAGAAYVPFDPTYPLKQLRFVYEDCAPALMLVQPAVLSGGAAPFWTGGMHDVRMALESPLPPGADAPLPETGPEDLAYIMYTSGSTGHPKGVLIPHRGVTRLVVDNPFAEMNAAQVHLQLAPLAFDASTFEIWGALLNGARLAVVSSAYPSLDDIAQQIAIHGVTTLWLTAGLFHLMVDHRLEGLTPLTQLIAGGDVLSPDHIARTQRAMPHCQLINGYGPTENTTFTCCYRIPAAGLTDPASNSASYGVPYGIPIGTAIAQTQVYILDDARSPVADGQEGELYTGGAGLALGYLNRPELTQERFVDDPFGEPGDAPGQGAGGRRKLYRTGDRVRRRADGNIEFLGRVDRQVKINGKRVELDEIEATLRRCALVEDAAVTSPTTPGGTRKVYAYVKPKTVDDNFINELRDFLKQELPDYMMPAAFTVMDFLPLTPTGKVDRAKLPPPTDASVSAVSPAAAKNEVEARLIEIWRTVLGTKVIGVDDNFFDLGGTSLQLIQVHATITAVMKSEVTVVDLFQYPRISALAARLVDHKRALMRRPDGSPDDDDPDPDSPPPGGKGGNMLSASDRAKRQQAALGRARNSSRPNVR